MRRPDSWLLQVLFAICVQISSNSSYADQRVRSHGYRIFVSVDMEGIAGAVSPKQFSNDGADYQQSRRAMTDEVLAAIAGCRKAGASEFVVTDGHGDGQNLLPEALPADVRLIRGVSMPLQMMEGIQLGKFDGAIFLGYHASASSTRGIQAHTFSSARISEIKLNGVPASEGYFNAAIAGQFGVPVILVSGDQAATDELVDVLKGAQLVVAKNSIAYQAAETISPSEAQRLISNAATLAVQHLGSVTPLKLPTPVTVEVTFHFYRPAELLAWLPGVARKSSRSIQYQSPDMSTAMQFLSFMLHYNVALEP
jgi:D-amino peptidase